MTPAARLTRFLEAATRFSDQMDEAWADGRVIVTPPLLAAWIPLDELARLITALGTASRAAFGRHLMH